ncbi:kelch-like protein 38 [Elysia marginata]|uniref:Kelch-like protein 38 n=1 Tax=Elysia marginata TaxID=1093978 RepID=A0AAV4IVW9_9GAST|nr:kelch-like protein 38 [Elysia marginata]
MADTGWEKDCKTSVRVFQDLATLKNDPTFSDIVVVVGNTEFHCHRAILAAVSSFFKAAFSTDMKEAREKKITLHNIEVEIFSAILNSIYGGRYIVTEENVYDIWTAADMLQIPFLCSQCEELCEILCNTKLTPVNCVDMLRKVRLLSEKTKQRALTVVCENFKDYHIQAKIGLLEADEMKILLTDDKLNVANEDDVVESILRWGEMKLKTTLAETSSDCSEEPGEEWPQVTSSLTFDQFEDLLRSTKYLLISWHCLHETLAQHPLVVANPECQTIMNKISQYKTNAHLHHTWCPPAAVQREKTKMINVLISWQDGSFNGLVLGEKDASWRELNLPPLASESGDSDASRKIFYDDSSLMVIDGNNIYMLEATHNQWHTTHILQDQYKQQEITGILILESVIQPIGGSLYLYQCRNGAVEIFKYPNFKNMSNFSDSEWNRCIAINDENFNKMSLKEAIYVAHTHILFLCDEAAKSYTIVCIDGVSYTHRLYSDQLGSQSRLVTFSHENEVFVLQENGFLWRLKPGVKELHIIQEFALWDSMVSLNGVVLYDNQLIVVGCFQDQCSDEVDVSLAGVFQGLKKINTCNLWACGQNISLVVLYSNRADQNQTQYNYNSAVNELNQIQFYNGEVTINPYHYYTWR